MLTTVILAKNEEKTIERAIQSASFSDEILIIDDDSTDKTVQIAKKLKATIYPHSLNGDFAAQRNFAMDKAKGDWILFLDADEEISGHLRSEIEDAVQSSSSIESYWIKRIDMFWGKEIRNGELKKASEKGFIRLVKKGSGTWKNAVHEEFIPIKQTGTLENFIIHYPHASITDFIQDVNIYSTLRSRELFKNGKRSNIFEIISVPFFKFIYTYFILSGFRDGAAGFVYSFLMSFHSFLVRAKLYQYEHISE